MCNHCHNKLNIKFHGHDHVFYKATTQWLYAKTSALKMTQTTKKARKTNDPISLIASGNNGIEKDPQRKHAIQQ